MERLVKILSDMIRSAIEWEQEHPSRSESDGKALTGIHHSYTLLPPEITRAGEKNDNDDDPEQKTANLRGSQGAQG